MAVDALLALDPSLERHVPLLLHLLSIPSQAHPLPANLQGDALRLAFEEALAAVAIASASKKPLVLIYEDWHWADEASESALRRLLPLVPQHPLLIVVLHRPDYAPRWGNPADHQAIALTALAPADTAAMLSSRLGAREVAPDLVALVHERTGGNPFFVEELAQSLLAEQGVAMREGRAGLAGTLDSSVIPASVEAVVRSRMDRLDPAAREVLRWASVIGRDFPRQILERVSCAGASLPAVLDRLAAEELIQPVRLLPEPEHRFKHVLAQVAVYESLLTGERKSRHAQVGAAIEQAYAGRLEEHYESLAHHYSNSDNLGKAIEYLEKAGDKAAKLVFKLQAENLLTSAIHLLGSLPSSDRTKRERVRITLKLCRASETSTSAARAGILEKAVSCCSEINDPHLLAELYFEFAQYYFFLGNLPKMREFLVLCRALSVEHRIGKLDTTTSGQLALQCYWQGQYELGIQYLAPYRNDLRRMDPIWLMFFLGNLHAAQGNFEEAYSILRDMSREVSEDPFLCAWSDWWFAYTSTVQGSWQFGIKHVERALVSMQQVEDQFGVVDAQWLRAYLFAMCGNLGPNLRSMKQAIDTKLSARNVTLGMTGILGLYAELCCLAGDWVSADHSAWRATEIAQATGEQHGMGIAQRASAMAATGKLQPDWNMVRARFDGCLKDFRTQGARPFLAVTQFRYAECLHKLGDLDAALAQLAQAETAFAELDMPWWLDQAEALRGRIERRDPFRGFAPYVNGPDAPVPE
jgi:tetratricopeptide (TPR) repeat protein